MNKAKRRKMLKWILIAAISLIIVAALGLLAGLASVQQFASADELAANVSIAGVPVGGLSQQAALAALQERFVPRLPAEVELTYPGGSRRLARERLGISLALPAAVTKARGVGREEASFSRLVTHLRLWRTGVDIPVLGQAEPEQLRSALTDLAAELNRPPRDAQITVEDDQVTTVPGLTGITVQIEASVEALKAAVTDPWLQQIELVAELQPPAITAEDLADVEVVLSSHSTPFNPGQIGRTHNLELAMARVNETLLKPGEEFSLNEVVGPRLTKDGYRSAPIFKDGEIVPETGGGVCQVTSTIYNAALLANLEITERHHHSRPVVYCPAGRDATVYFGQLDLRFRNSLSHPILILGGREGNRLWTKLLGSKEDDYDVKLVRTDIATLSFAVKNRNDPTLEAGKQVVETPGRSGLRVKVFREVYRDDKLLQRQRLHTDTYGPQAQVVRVGTKPAEVPEEEPPGPGLAPMPPPLPPVAVPPGVEPSGSQ